MEKWRRRHFWVGFNTVKNVTRCLTTREVTGKNPTTDCDWQKLDLPTNKAFFWMNRVKDCHQWSKNRKKWNRTYIIRKVNSTHSIHEIPNCLAMKKNTKRHIEGGKATWINLLKLGIWELKLEYWPLLKTLKRIDKLRFFESIPSSMRSSWHRSLATLLFHEKRFIYCSVYFLLLSSLWFLEVFSNSVNMRLNGQSLLIIHVAAIIGLIVLTRQLKSPKSFQPGWISNALIPWRKFSSLQFYLMAHYKPNG